MNRKPVTISADALVHEAAEIQIKQRLFSVAVVDAQHRLVGFFSQQGCMLALLDVVHHSIPECPVTGYLDPRPPTISEETSLLSIAHLFTREGYRHAVLAVLRDARLVGTVTRLDVIRAVENYIAGVKDTASVMLYMSALKEMDETPPFGR
jgi:CBS domain-containing protein